MSSETAATTVPKLGVAVIGFGWMGQAHSRSYLRIPTLFPDRAADPELIICADNVEPRGQEAVRSFGFAESTTDPARAIEHPDVDIVVVAAPEHAPRGAVCRCGRGGQTRLL